MPKESTEAAAPRIAIRKSSNHMTKVFGFLIIILAGIAFYFYTQYNDLKADPEAQATEEIDALVMEVGKLIVLPADERPTVATVTDMDKLKDQPFFANAQNGYKVLIYTQAKKAILYDPIARKIIEVAPINIGDSQARTAPKPAPAPAPAPVTPNTTGETTGSAVTP